MKTLQGRMKLFSLLAALLFILAGCNQDAPIAALDETPQTDRPTAISASGKTIQFLSFTDTRAAALSKTTTVQTFIQKNQGGSLVLNHFTDAMQAYIQLDVAAGAIDFSKTISMTFDDENYEGFTDIVFGPHGTQYSTPALLDVIVTGVDLTGVDPNNVHLYYVNDNGVWEEMIVSSITIDFYNSRVIIIDAQLPHFSRYAIGAD